MTDASGNVLSTQKYWPYGATRSGGPVTQTDKLYTGQQTEPGDSALGLYNYKARFYSTSLGRFVSADSVAKDGLNRYAYVRNSPLTFVDPSGLDAALFCGTGERCESGSIDNFRQWVEEYWAQHEHIFGGDSPIPGMSMANYAFTILTVVLGYGWGQGATLSAFHIGFFDTSTGPVSGKLSYAKRDLLTGIGDLEGKFFNVQRNDARGVDTLIGYSLGGYVVASILASGYAPATAILIQPAFHVHVGPFDLGMGNPLSAAPALTRIITVNGSDSPVGGEVFGAINITTSGCGHCATGSLAGFAIWAGMQQPGSAGDAAIEDVGAALDVDVRLYSPPIPVPLPLAGE